MPDDVPGLDGGGFIDLIGLRARARFGGREEFLRVHALPALLVIGIPDEMADVDELPEWESLPYATLLQDAEGRCSRSLARYRGLVAFLRKRGRNALPELITVGRAANNDVVVALQSVSKLHLVFRPEPNGWSLSDRGSTNGTFLNGHCIEPEVPTPVADGDRVRLGRDFTVLFLQPASLLERLQ